MGFLAPIWLVGVGIWGAVVIVLLIGRLKRVRVPFLKLWEGPEAKPRERRGVEWPPAALALAMLAMLLAVLAAARPVMRTSGILGMPNTIVIDRGASMSARGEGGTRFIEVINRAAEPINQTFEHAPVELLSVPGPEAVRSDAWDWASLSRAMAPTAVDTGGALRALVAQRLAETRRAVIVISDQPIGIEDRRLIQIAPQTMPRNVAIVRLAARERPAAQVMVRVRNQGGPTGAMARVVSEGRELARTRIELPGTGQLDYFLDVRGIGRWVAVELEVEDDLPADNRAFLLRQRAWPIVEARAAIPAELGRVIELYGRLRPAGEGSKHVAVVSSTDALPANEPGAAAAGPGGLPSTPGITGPVKVVDHAVTRAVSDWQAAVRDAAMIAGPADPSWTAVVSVAGQALVAVREQPIRQVWVGFASSHWPSSPDFVVFWSSAFNWLGEGSEAFVAHPVSRLAEGWKPIEGLQVPKGVEAGLWPGIWQGPDGTLRAVNAEAVDLQSPAPSNWRESMTRAKQDIGRQEQGRSLAAGLLMAALVAMGLAALVWRSRSGPARTAAQPKMDAAS